MKRVPLEVEFGTIERKPGDELIKTKSGQLSQRRATISRCASSVIPSKRDGAFSWETKRQQKIVLPKV